MFKFIKKLLFGKVHSYVDVEKERVQLTPEDEWYIPQLDTINNQLIFHKSCCDETVSLTYVVESNKLKLCIAGKSTPANVTTRVQKTINNRLKKAGEEEIAVELFDLWEAELIAAQGKGKGTYASLRIKAK